MNTRFVNLVFGIVACAACACSDSTDPADGTGGAAGASGAAGTSGTAGAAGSSGTAGAAGTASFAGAAGASGLECEPDERDSMCDCGCGTSHKLAKISGTCEGLNGLLCDDGVRFETCVLDHEVCSDFLSCPGNTVERCLCECGSAPWEMGNDGPCDELDGTVCDPTVGTTAESCTSIYATCAM